MADPIEAHAPTAEGDHDPATAKALAAGVLATEALATMNKGDQAPAENAEKNSLPSTESSLSAPPDDLEAAFSPPPDDLEATISTPPVDPEAATSTPPVDTVTNNMPDVEMDDLSGKNPFGIPSEYLTVHQVHTGLGRKKIKDPLLVRHRVVCLRSKLGHPGRAGFLEGRTILAIANVLVKRLFTFNELNGGVDKDDGIEFAEQIKRLHTSDAMHEWLIEDGWEVDRFGLLVRAAFMVPFPDITLPEVAVIEATVEKALNDKFKIDTTRVKGPIKFTAFDFTPAQMAGKKALDTVVRFFVLIIVTAFEDITDPDETILQEARSAKATADEKKKADAKKRADARKKKAEDKKKADAAKKSATGNNASARKRPRKQPPGKKPQGKRPRKQPAGKKPQGKKPPGKKPPGKKPPGKKPPEKKPPRKKYRLKAGSRL
jgi:hypothetical protein